ncbi:MAG TPA: alpha-amylase family glycosyl hydrolase [Roseiflexaceae bacterium]|nr:alpha-amylase family glycosyl hydrolase [Roseiflexaceae bacterium]
MTSWAKDAVFYHIYPLGLCGAPRRNDFSQPAVARLDQLEQWIGHLRELGVSALYLGPVFESSAHGYDTADFFQVDRRLGSNATLRQLCASLHAAGIRIVLDGVFHHVGRDFWAFRDLLARGEASPYRHWFAGVDFGRRSPYGDPFAYDGWHGHYDLVKLNLQHPEVRAHLFEAVRMWVGEFHIDGLRLDAADVIDQGFLRDLAAFCRSLRPDFWLLGEVIHGDYRQWANPHTLDSTTNYECYKGLFSSHNDANYFEIAYSLNRQFGEHGIYCGLSLYAFADNHDVNRIASTLRNPAHLYPLHALLFTMPGIPSLYYGSEWGIAGVKTPGDDGPLRPALRLPEAVQQAPHPDLALAIARFARLRHEQPALRHGGYQQLHVDHQRLAFARRLGGEELIVAVSAADQTTVLELPTALRDGARLVDLLDPSFRCHVHGQRIRIDPLPANWARVLRVQ